VPIPFHKFLDPENALSNPNHCIYSFELYPTDELRQSTSSNLPAILVSAIAGAFALMLMAFTMFNYFVDRRNDKIVSAAAKFNTVIASLFPDNVRDRLFNENDNELDTTRDVAWKIENTRLGQSNKGQKVKSKAIADLFPNTTIMFADIVGFTAWSATREPTHVFLLLETLYASFDEIAVKKRVYKVETIGDCYVAVAGLPKPDKDHAISTSHSVEQIQFVCKNHPSHVSVMLFCHDVLLLTFPFLVAMAKFSTECVRLMHRVKYDLVAELGPETTNLDLRVGLHSGAVMAGVLRGERSRFQLFGDTMNTASRMESTAPPGQIHLSQHTAEILVSAGKRHWVAARNDQVTVKGKGVMQTYLLNIASANSGTSASSDYNEARTGDIPSFGLNASEQNARLVDWYCDVVRILLKKLAFVRSAVDGSSAEISPFPVSLNVAELTPFDEVKESIDFGQYREAVIGQSIVDPSAVELHEAANIQLQMFVSSVAMAYNNHPFHCFEYACHAGQCALKLCSWLIQASDETSVTGSKGKNTSPHDRSCGLSSDPWVPLSLVFVTLILGVAHPGVSNAEMVREQSPLAAHYHQGGITEQNALDISWGLLMKDEFKDLRAWFFQSREELIRFRGLVVNLTLAADVTNIAWAERSNIRWITAFGPSASGCLTEQADIRATLVLEDMIRLSAFAYKCHHWQIYCKWNERLFAETYRAYRTGECEANPRTFWYQQELHGFDSVVIPLGEKLISSKMFGISVTSLIENAKKNRSEWNQRGQEIVEKMWETALRS
jgi:class 3 adenylate cyclase